MKRTVMDKRRTKIICTIGPATGSAQMIEKLIKGGMNVARLNLSHGTYALHARYLKTIRRLAKRLDKNVAILIDLPGPKYRTGKLREEKVVLKKGATVVITTRTVIGDATLVPVNLPNLPHDVRIRDTVLINDGAIQLKVKEKTDTDVVCRVVVGGVLTEGRGLVVPGMYITGPFVTDILHKHIRFAIEQQPDYLAISFVSEADEVLAVKSILTEARSDIPIVAKIEREQAIKHFDRILEASDGIMVARGDLGVDIPLEKVPLVQKEIIQKSNRAGKPVITATEMLESMVKAYRPTRAEITDVANAILDGTDATMLSAETSVGKYPVQAVKMMARVACETEKTLQYVDQFEKRKGWLETKTSELIAYDACQTAYMLGAKTIVAFTQSGSTVARVSKYRPNVPVLAITHNRSIARRMVLLWGVYPVALRELMSLDDLFVTGADIAKKLRLVRSGDLIVITGGIPVGVSGSTNLLKVEQIR